MSKVNYETKDCEIKLGGFEREEPYVVNKGLTVEELIKELMKFPKDTKVVMPHFYKTLSGGLRQKVYDVVSVTPGIEMDSNKLLYVIINSNLKYEDINNF